jgi:hypothetical protein
MISWQLKKNIRVSLVHALLVLPFYAMQSCG